MVKKRNAWIAGIASFFVPGLGHAYAGAPMRGWLIVAGFIAALIIGGLFGLFSTFYGIVAIVLVTLLFYLVLISSAVRWARRNPDYELRWFNCWYCYIAILVLVTAGFQALFIFRGPILGYETFRIPSGSMAPTLETGDFITVNTRYREPLIGDVVVFRWPGKPEVSYVSRIAAMGGDAIAIRNGQVLVNGMPQERLVVSEGNRQKEFSVNMLEQRVSEGQLFMLGDWRDNSNDSRFLGTVPQANVVGEVTYIWFSSDSKRIGRQVR